MPYQRNSDLPSSIKKVLPQRAATIFRKSFNSAFKKYRTDSTSMKIAWSVVKRSGYSHSKNGKWVKK